MRATLGGYRSPSSHACFGAFAQLKPKLRWNWRGVQGQLIVGLLCLPLGVFAAGWFSAMRLTLSHLELIGALLVRVDRAVHREFFDAGR